MTNTKKTLSSLDLLILTHYENYTIDFGTDLIYYNEDNPNRRTIHIFFEGFRFSIQKSFRHLFEIGLLARTTRVSPFAIKNPKNLWDNLLLSGNTATFKITKKGIEHLTKIQKVSLA